MNSKLSSKSAVDEMYDLLLARIMNREWEIGEKLPSESQLCKEYHVSRISARSVLQRLQALHVIVTKPGKGSFLLSYSVPDADFKWEHFTAETAGEDYRYFIELRRAIEFSSLPIFCERADNADFDNLRCALALMHNYPIDSPEFIDGDLLYHTTLIKGTHNPLFIAIFENCKAIYIQRFSISNKNSVGNKQQVCQAHQAAYEALLQKKPDLARFILESESEFTLKQPT